MKTWKTETYRMIKQLSNEFTIDELRKIKVVIRSDLKPRILGDFKMWEEESFVMADENGFLVIDSTRLINWIDKIKENNGKTYENLLELANQLKITWKLKV